MFALAAAGVLLTGCAKIEQEESQPSASVATATTQLATEAETVPAQQYPSVALQVPEITRQDVSMKLEAEDAAIPSGCSVAMMPRLGYSGNGYLSGLDAKNDSSLVLNAEIPATQHYDITVVVGASAASTCKIQVDGETVYTMKTDATNNFMRVKIQGIFLNAGACELSVAPVDGIVDILQKPAAGKTVSFFYITSNGAVNVRKSTDYIAEMLSLAGGKYIFDDLTDDTAKSTVNMQMESFYAGAKDADVMIYNATIDSELQTLDQLLEKSPLLADFKAVKTGNVWCTEKNLYQSTMELDELIRDFHTVIADGNPSTLKYLHKLS